MWVIGRVFDAAAAIVVLEADEGIVELALTLELREDASDPFVHDLDLGGIDFHPPLLPIFVRLVFPRRHVRVPWGELPIRIDDSQLLHSGVSLIAKLVPAERVVPPVFRDVALAGMKRPVGGVVSHVEKEGFVLVICLYQEIDGIVGYRVSEIVGGVFVLLGTSLVVSHQRVRRKVAVGPDNATIESIESSLTRKVREIVRGRGQMPFAAHVRSVTGASERLGKGRCTVGDVRLLQPRPFSQFEREVALNPRHQGRSRRRAHVVCVEACEAHPTETQPVQVRGADFASVTAQVGVTHVVGHDHDDVGPLAGRTGITTATTSGQQAGPGCQAEIAEQIASSYDAGNLLHRVEFTGRCKQSLSRTGCRSAP